MTEQKQNKQHRSHKKLYIVVGCIISFVLIVDIVITGYIEYGLSYVKCGHAPIVSPPNRVFGGYGWYSFPGSRTYTIVAGAHYFCTYQEAETSGALPNPFSKEGAAREAELDAQKLKTSN